MRSTWISQAVDIPNGHLLSFSGDQCAQSCLSDWHLKFIEWRNFALNLIELKPPYINTVFLAVKCGISQQVPFATVINGKRPADHINRFNYAVLTVLSHSIIVLHSFAQSAVQLQMIHIHHQFIHSIFEFKLKENLDHLKCWMTI